MEKDLKRATELLTSGEYTCVFVNRDQTITSTERGVAPLLKLVESGKNLKGFCAADKVVGRAAAFLYVLLTPEKLFAQSLSESAKAVLEQNGIPVCYNTLTQGIINRKGDGPCPMEQATKHATTPTQALFAIRSTLEKLSW